MRTKKIQDKKTIKIDKTLYRIVYNEFLNNFNKIAEEKKELELYNINKKYITKYDNILILSKQDSEENNAANKKNCINILFDHLNILKNTQKSKQ